jgi:hypothetical protein
LLLGVQLEFVSLSVEVVMIHDVNISSQFVRAFKQF